jgi:GTP pyrophosphokinase
MREWHDTGSKQTPGARAIPISGLSDGMAVRLGDCCHPMPGDRIVGIMIPGEGVKVHSIDCDKLAAYSEEPDRWLDLAWRLPEDAAVFFTGRLELVVLNEMGALANIASVVAKRGGNIANLTIAERDREFHTMRIDVEVRDLRHLIDILASLRAIRVVNSAERLRS